MPLRDQLSCRFMEIAPWLEPQIRTGDAAGKQAHRLFLHQSTRWVLNVIMIPEWYGLREALDGERSRCYTSHQAFIFRDIARIYYGPGVAFFDSSSGSVSPRFGTFGIAR